MSAVLFLIAGAYSALLLSKAWLAMSYARSLPLPKSEAMPAGNMTIGQAILSGDPLLESRLAANLRELTGQSFLWLIDEEDAGAKRIVEALLASNPDADVRTEICPPCPDATNPKLWKLRRAASLVRTPHFCVLDDDSFLPAASAAALVEAAATRTVATGLPCYLDSGDVASGLLAQFVNNNSVFTYLGTSRLLPPMTLNGMGYAMRASELSGIGNFEPILHELTDDLALASLVLRQGGTIHQSAAPLFVQTGLRDVGHYFQLMHRWYVFTLLLLRRQSVPVQVLIFVLHGLPPLLLAALFVMAGIGPQPASGLVLAAVLALRLMVIRTILRRFFRRQLHRPALSVLSELLQPAHLVHALASRTIRWRSRRYHVRGTNDFTPA
jgi:ceramide glucosyltransferase